MSEALSLADRDIDYFVLVRGQMAASLEMYQELVELMEKHRIEPFIGQVFQWSEAREAFRAQMKQTVPGKIVIKV